MQRRGKGGRPAKGSRATRPKVRKRQAAHVSAAGHQEQFDRRTRELDEALQQQIATNEVLGIIRRSPADVQPVFEAIVQSAARLCGAIFSVVYLYENNHLRAAATKNFSAEATSQLNERYELRQINRSYAGGRAFIDRAIAHISDVLGDPEYSREFALAGGWQAVLAVPLLSEGKSVGVISVGKAEPKAFSKQQIQLLQTFADQAVIAIENARLLNELRESLQQQTATADVLKVISSSPGNLEPIFGAVLENATQICQAGFGTLNFYENGAFHTAALHNPPPQFAMRLGAVINPHPESGLAYVARTKSVAHIDDIRTLKPYLEGNQAVVDLADLAGARTLLIVPMVKEGELIGTISIYRQEIRPFSDKQIELVKNFAAQAVIAIENTRLLSELRQRTDDLSKSLEDLRTTQDRLVQTQKLALLGQLTAGIAHEIKNPLNFVNNFSGISAELIEELRDTLKEIPLDDKARTEINELTNTLKSNFDKVVHHGGRADAIVKNMLQHSREGSGEHRVIDINALVEESLNLAWHGARAEAQGFEIKLKQSFDPSAGEADIFPQDIRRALLNMISNGFYAATIRRTQNNGGEYEPTLKASTKNLGDQVEISIRDNGTGMPPDVKEKMFNPFFTTKPTGEGTGLGLSISHDIIVKQHGGSIEVDTQPGQFTEIRVILPRSAVFV
jgi:two-component system, NtrC family, sensor kinase